MPDPKKVTGPELERQHQQAPRHPLHIEKQAKLRSRRLLRKFRDYLVALVKRWMARPESYVTIIGDARAYGEELADAPTHAAAIHAGGRRMGTLLKHKIAELVLDEGTEGIFLDDVVDDYTTGAILTVHDAIEIACEEVAMVLDEWLALDPEARIAADPAVIASVSQRVDAATGRALNRYEAQFVATFFKMNQRIQRQVGLDEYVWLTRRDKSVRSPKGDTFYYGWHKPLEGVICRWDTPPLTADKATIREPCHAGQDINCRCIAFPWRRKSKPN